MDSLVEKYFSDVGFEKEVLIAEAAEKIQTGGNKILALVEALGGHLTSTDVEARVKACELLSTVLKKLPSSVLTSSEINVIVNFLCCRLQDHYTLQAAIIDGLCWASASSQLSALSATGMLKAMFKEVHVQSCLQGERYKIYLILTNLFDQHKIEVSAMGRDFLYSFIQAVDGEQDPRNLLVVFQLAADVIRSGFNLENLTEDLFEVISCYFPIDFNPGAANKKGTISSEDLVLGLRGALSSTRAFAKFCIPLVLEKMDSDVQSAKIDAMRTLTACLPKYTKTDLEPFTSTIWKAVKRELVHSVSEEAEKSGLQLLTELVKNITTWPIDEHDGSKVDLHRFLSEVVDDCLTHLKEPIQDKLKWMSSQMILASAKASPEACSEVVKSVFTLIIHQALDSEQDSVTKSPVRVDSAMDMLVQILIICKTFIFQQNPLLPYKSDLLTLILANLRTKSVTVKCTAVTACAALLGQKVLTDDEVEGVATLLLDITLDATCDAKVRAEILATFSYLVIMQSHIVRRSLLPKVLEELNKIEVTCSDGTALKVSLECATSLSGHFEIFQDIIKPLMSKLDECSLDEEHCTFVTETIAGLKSIAHSYLSDQMYVEFMALNVCLPLMKLCIQSSLSPSAPGQCCASCNDSTTGYSQECITLPLMQSAASIIRNVCQKLRPGKTADFVCRLISDLYINNDILAFEIKDTPSFPFLPLDPSLYPLQTRTVCFLPASICAFDRSVGITNADQLLNKLLLLATNSPDLPTYVGASKAFAGLINKQDQISTEFLQKISESVKKAWETQGNDKRLNNKNQSIALLIWVTKALAQRNHVNTMEFVKMLLEKFADPDVGEMAAAGFSIIMRESDEVLNPSSHAVIRLMYRQRLFLQVLPQIVDAFQIIRAESASETDDQIQKTKANYLTALSEMLVLLPKQVLLAQFTNLLPLLMQSLQSQVPSLLLSALSALLNLIQDSPELIESHADTLLDSFMPLSTFQGNMSVRLKAITCIGALTLLPASTILPVKLKVIRSLCSNLDDKKRAVRMEAAKARSEWCLVGT